MTNCNDHSRFVISITWGSSPDGPGSATSRVLPMEAETSTRNIVTVYYDGRGEISVTVCDLKATKTHSRTFRGHLGYGRWWSWGKALSVEARPIAVPLAPQVGAAARRVHTT